MELRKERYRWSVVGWQWRRGRMLTSTNIRTHTDGKDTPTTTKTHTQRHTHKDTDRQTEIERVKKTKTQKQTLRPQQHRDWYYRQKYTQARQTLTGKNKSEDLRWKTLRHKRHSDTHAQRQTHRHSHRTLRVVWSRIFSIKVVVTSFLQ